MHSETTIHRNGSEDFRSLEEVVVAAMKHYCVSGIAIGVIHKEREFSAGFGITNANHPLPVDVNTLFQIGSITKTVTGTAVMRLIEMGLLDLDAPLRTYLPDLELSHEEVTTTVTMRHLLTHTAGWPGDYFADLGAGDDALARIVAQMVQLPQLTAPGTFWGYNNAGFYIAGRVIEALTGKTYEAAVKELVLDPLGMSRSFFFAEEVITHRFTVGHLIESNAPEVVRSWSLPRVAHPAGGLISSVTDQLRYARFHLGNGTTSDGQRILTTEHIALMQTPQVRETVSPTTIGLTWWMREIGGIRLIENEGATYGQQAVLLLVPQQQFALTILTNTSTGSQLYEEVTRWALRNYLALTEPEEIRLELLPEQLLPYIGQYTDSFTDLAIDQSDNQLALQIKPTSTRATMVTGTFVHLAFCGKDRVIALDTHYQGIHGEFLRDANAAIKWFRFAGRIAMRRSNRDTF